MPGRDRPERRPGPQEHLSSLAPRPAALQIGGDRRAHIRGQRQPVGSSALAAHHQFACPPVDVIEPQPGHLAGPQPQPQHRGDYRVVASPDRRTTITASKQRLGIRLGDPPRQRRAGADRVAGSAACDRSASTSPSMKQKRRNDRSPATKNWVALTDTARGLAQHRPRSRPRPSPRQARRHRAIRPETGVRGSTYPRDRAGRQSALGQQVALEATPSAPPSANPPAPAPRLPPHPAPAAHPADTAGPDATTARGVARSARWKARNSSTRSPVSSATASPFVSSQWLSRAT